MTRRRVRRGLRPVHQQEALRDATAAASSSRTAHGNLTKINYDNVTMSAAMKRVAIVDYGMCNLDSVAPGARGVRRRAPCVADDAGELARRRPRSCCPASARSPTAMAQPARARAGRRAARARGRARRCRCSASASACSCWPTSGDGGRRRPPGSGWIRGEVRAPRRHGAGRARPARRLERGRSRERESPLFARHPAGRATSTSCTASTLGARRRRRRARDARPTAAAFASAVAARARLRRRSSIPRRASAPGFQLLAQLPRRSDAHAEGPRHPDAAVQGLRPGQGRRLRLAGARVGSVDAGGQGLQPARRRRARLPRHHGDAARAASPTSSWSTSSPTSASCRSRSAAASRRSRTSRACSQVGRRQGRDQHRRGRDARRSSARSPAASARSASSSSIDVRRDADGALSVLTPLRARADTGRDPVDAGAEQAEAAGAGEILLTSIDRDGTMPGYDLDADRAASRDAVTIPVIASGGAGTLRAHGRRRRSRRGASRGGGREHVPLHRADAARGEAVSSARTAIPVRS